MTHPRGYWIEYCDITQSDGHYRILRGMKIWAVYCEDNFDFREEFESKYEADARMLELNAALDNDSHYVDYDLLGYDPISGKWVDCL